MRIQLLVRQEVVQQLLRAGLVHLGFPHGLRHAIEVSLGLDHLLVEPLLGIFVQVLRKFLQLSVGTYHDLVLRRGHGLRAGARLAALVACLPLLSSGHQIRLLLEIASITYHSLGSRWHSVHLLHPFTCKLLADFPLQIARSLLCEILLRHTLLD